MELKEARRQNLLLLIKGHQTQKAFSEKSGMDPAHVSQIVTGTRNMGEKVARHIEDKLNLSRGWMDVPQLEYFPTDNMFGEPHPSTPKGKYRVSEPAPKFAGGEGFSNTTRGPEIRELPLISWVQAGQWCGVEDPYELGDYEKKVPVGRAFSKEAFCLRVRGDSMESPTGPTFPDGCIIAVEPRAPVKNMSFVVVRLENSSEATFKQYVEDAGKKYLKPLNPRWPLIEVTEDAVFCGVVKHMIMEFD